MRRALTLLVTSIAAALVATPMPVSSQTPRRESATVRMSPPPKKGEIVKLPLDEIGAVPREGGGQIGRSACVIGPSSARCDPHAKIVGNALAAPEYRFVVAIYFDMADGDRRICTGILLTPDLVLTAGHCGCGVPGRYAVDYRQDTRSGPERGKIKVDGAPILFDSRVCSAGLLEGGRDLALLRLSNRVNLNKPRYGYPRELIWQLRRKLPVGRRLIAVGYGYTDSGRTGVRMQGTIPVVTADCADRRYAATCAPFAEMILAEAPGPRVRTDTCGGDSGGPVFLLDDDKVPTLIGITSRAAPGLQDNAILHCGGGGIYVLIGRASVQAWLREYGVPEANPEAKDIGD